MRTLLFCILSFMAGGTFGVVMMCLFQINNHQEERQRDEQT